MFLPRFISSHCLLMAPKAMKAMKTMQAMKKTSPRVIEFEKHWSKQHTGKFLTWTLVSSKDDGKPDGWVTEKWHATCAATKAKKAMKVTKGAMKVKK